MYCGLLIELVHIHDKTLAHLVANVVNVLVGRRENTGPDGVSALRKGLLLALDNLPVWLPDVGRDGEGDVCPGDLQRPSHLDCSCCGLPSCNGGGGHFLLPVDFMLTDMYDDV
jgi:hypothetical protein